MMARIIALSLLLCALVCFSEAYESRIRRSDGMRIKRDVNDWGNWLSNKMGNVVHTLGSEAADKRYEEIVNELTAKKEQLEQMQIYKDINRLEEELLAYTNAGMQEIKNKLQNFRIGIMGHGGNE